MEFLKEIGGKRCLFTVRVRMVSERIVSLFSQYRTECIAMMYKDPISKKTRLILMNAFGLKLPLLSHISTETLLSSPFCDEINAYEIQTEESQYILERFHEAEECSPSLWLQRLCNRFWSVRNKDKNPFLQCLSKIKDKEALASYVGKKKDKMDSTHKVFIQDMKFLGEIWPSLCSLLMDNEFRFSVAMSNDQSFLHTIGRGIEEGKINYSSISSAKYKNVIPPLTENKAVVIQVSPCKPMDTVCYQLEQFYHDIEASIEKGKGVEFSLPRLRTHINDLLQCNGRDLLSPPSKGSGTGVRREGREEETTHVLCNLIVGEEEKEERIIQGERSFTLYDSMDVSYFSSYYDMQKEEVEEILRYVDGIAQPTKPYLQLRSALTEWLASPSK